MTSHARHIAPRFRQAHRALTVLGLLGCLASAHTAMAQDAQVEARRHRVVTHTGNSAEGMDAANANAALAAKGSTNTRTWLDAQASGTQASSHRQTLNGPAMSRVYQRLLTQLGGKGQGAEGGGDASSDLDADTKSNPASDLLKGLGALKP